jgi:hypothetical protein
MAGGQAYISIEHFPPSAFIFLVVEITYKICIDENIQIPASTLQNH